MAERKIPLRKCVGCGEMKDKRTLVRIVRSKEGVISVDLTGKMPGRGAYICRDAACVDKAIKIRAVQHALGQGLTDRQEKAIKEALQADE